MGHGVPTVGPFDFARVSRVTPTESVVRPVEATPAPVALGSKIGIGPALTTGSLAPVAPTARVRFVPRGRVYMSDARGPDKGAHFRRCDFQVHTPRDNQWKGSSDADDASRRAYAAAFVQECRRISLDAVAISDHHDFIFFPFIREAAMAELGPHGDPLPERDLLTVFPALELTLGAPTFQAILILDADFPEDRLSDVLKALSIDPHDPDEARLPSVTSLDHILNPKALHEELDKRDFLDGRYIVLPNVTNSGHGTMLRKGMKVPYREMPCVGGYLDGPIEKVGAGNARIFAGEDPNYGNKRIALFQTSDARSADFKDLGKVSTWVKWATPTAEALRQACLAQESRVSQSEPELPNITISKITVSNSAFLGPVTFDLNPQYNAIIGGRGTGKSTLLGYLRWALCDQPEEDEGSETGSLGVRQRRLIEKTLTPYDARVEVDFQINGVHHIVRRSASDGEVQLKVGGGEFGVARETEIRALLPVHAYSQKQLSSVAVRIDELTRFIAAPINNRLDEIDRQVADVAARLRENYATVQRARVLDVAISRSSLEIESLDTQSENLRVSLAGLSEGDQRILAAKAPHDRLRAFVRAHESTSEEVADALDTALARIRLLAPPTADPSELPETLRDQALEIGGATAAAVAKAAADVEDALASLRASQAPGGDLGIGVVAVSTAVDAFEASYDSVKERSTAHEAKLTELGELERRAATARSLHERQLSDRAALGEPMEEHTNLREQMSDLGGQRSDAIDEQCQLLNSLSEGLIRAVLERGVGLDGVRERFQGVISGSGVRGAKVDLLFETLRTEDDPLATWSEVLTELEFVSTIDSDVALKSSDAPNLSRLGFPAGDQERIRSRVTADAWLELALTPVLDQPIFKYRVKEADYIDFDVASAGQQATALLIVLLAQPGMPLLIDQPEDDLDSQIILDIVTRLWAAKSRRQIVFTSHNANLVVNGDAELVVVCENRNSGDQSGGMVSHLGAIDVDEVRDAITQIMEGGESAFKLRKAKYGF